VLFRLLFLVCDAGSTRDAGHAAQSRCAYGRAREPVKPAWLRVRCLVRCGRQHAADVTVTLVIDCDNTTVLSIRQTAAVWTSRWDIRLGWGRGALPRPARIGGPSPRRFDPGAGGLRVVLAALGARPDCQR
jgi:hypothetical protein